MALCEKDNMIFMRRGRYRISQLVVYTMGAKGIKVGDIAMST